MANDIINLAENIKHFANRLIAVECEYADNSIELARCRRNNLEAFDDIWHEHPALLRHAVESIKDKNVTPDEWFELLKDEENHHIWLEAHWATEGQKYEIYNSAKFYVNLLYDGE